MSTTSHKKNRSNAKASRQGPKEHFQGPKLDFLLARADTYQLALDTKATNIFYNTVICDFIAKFRESESFNSVVVDNPPDPVDLDIDNEDPELTNEEATTSALLYEKLCKVTPPWMIIFCSN